jgi:hypothetical protein
MMAVKELIDPQPVTAPIIDPPWYVMLTEPQQDLTTVWRLHELGLEMFVPVLRRRVKTGRIGKNGHKVTRVIAKPMFPGYGFLRVGAPLSPCWRRAAFAASCQTSRAIPSSCRTDGSEATKSGSTWTAAHMLGLWPRSTRSTAKGRIEVLLGMIRHTLPADMVVAA